MSKFSMTCSCGHEMSAEAPTREEAVQQVKAMMTQEAVEQHLAEKHPEGPSMTMAQVHSQIEQMLAPVYA